MDRRRRLGSGTYYKWLYNQDTDELYVDPDPNGQETHSAIAYRLGWRKANFIGGYALTNNGNPEIDWTWAYGEQPGARARVRELLTSWFHENRQLIQENTYNFNNLPQAFESSFGSTMRLATHLKTLNRT